ncbi:uncharacterized protein LOC130715970 [Lotus japonicus]|uniref:uncharacterized protein LOC130715958 n=1 Tax=Lotus japonicus TaxID=34305 RepID=UPI00258EAE48|nr:uncharacterized protein LOC130715958 [Lotus japonicus]XP_057422106.1 uncharacterized protein LOC130715958 [Lotus japonicus]XP_057422107.1 uncharacterized protein LOC130715958 [Lotus japonicus]XP_057422108.1 uncharacterized protein LOC130715958 [Lotus japonicus]XP_057422119.1 uncharacterized protein LOC130715970 [Lotus japonicus]XP_057422120.1 uncharacterized protein LOC130715970 [Lotus japonicus]XP_057422121.1 uncharacterized protein LOC130715970 [Lotus japonicus]XP_057422122.1 uncharacte
MEHQSSGRFQRPKGTSTKQTLKVMLVLAVCAWLVYQIQNSRSKTENYGSQTKIVVSGYGAKSLGRKGIESRLDEKALPGEHVSKNAESEFLEKENGEDAGVTEDIDEVQSFNDENGVPPDGNETDIVIGENIPNVGGSWVKMINIYEVRYGEDNDVEVNLEGSNKGVTAEEEINMGTIAHDDDTSGIKSNSEIGEGGRVVL